MSYFLLRTIAQKLRILRLNTFFRSSNTTKSELSYDPIQLEAIKEHIKAKFPESQLKYVNNLNCFLKIYLKFVTFVF